MAIYESEAAIPSSLTDTWQQDFSEKLFTHWHGWALEPFGSKPKCCD